MIYKFILLSDEVDNFMREIQIDSEATFMELHDAILDSVKYGKDQITSFFVCNEDWEKEQEITQIEMDTSSECRRPKGLRPRLLYRPPAWHPAWLRLLLRSRNRQHKNPRRCIRSS